MDHDSGQLSIDFIIGFGIFLVAFIFVAVLVSGLLVGLQSKTIDYDAVAYRTSVILVEDPGWSAQNDTKWESESDIEKITRFGLAISKDYPNILSSEKVEKFFNSSFNANDDRDKLLLNKSGQYPYHYNITLSDYPSQGDGIYPNKSGYIKRVVLIREPFFSDYISVNTPVEYVNVSIDFPNLNSTEREIPYRISPSDENITIYIENMASTPLKLLHANLTYPSLNLTQGVLIDNQPWVEGDAEIPCNFNITAVIPVDYFINRGLSNEPGIFVFQFAGAPAGSNITSDVQPVFKRAELEVRIW